MVRCCVALAVTALCLASTWDCVAAQTPTSALPNRSVSLGKGSKLQLNFRFLFPNRQPGMVATLSTLPTIGEIFAAQDASRSKWKNIREAGAPYQAEGNFFEYRSVFRTSPADALASGAQPNYFPTGTESLPVLIDDGEKYQSNILVRVFNSPPRIPSRTFRMPAFVDGAAPVARNFTIQIQDRDAPNVYPHVTEIESVVLFRPPDPDACVLRTLAGEALTQPNITLARRLHPLSLSLQMALLSSAKPCNLLIVATDASGETSNPPTMLKFEALSARPPFVINTTSRFVMGADKKVNLEFVGYSANSIGAKTTTTLEFRIDKVPTVGELWDTSDPELGLDKKRVTDGMMVYRGNKTRVVLVYVPPPNLAAMIASGATMADVTVPYTVTNPQTGLSASAYVNVHLSKAQPPSCDSSSYFPVFWDQPVRSVQIPYQDVDGRVERVLLVSTPPDPLGDLISVIDTTSKLGKNGGVNLTALKAGDLMTDRMRSLRYTVRPSNRGKTGVDTFVFRAMTGAGLACHGNITFFVVDHDQPRDAATGAEQRYEIAPDNSFTLFPLWGRANRSLLKGVDLATSTVTAVVDDIDEGAQWFRFTAEKAPYDAGLTYRGQIGVAAYCRRYNCTSYAGAQIQRGDAIDFTTLWDSTEVATSENRVWVLFKANSALSSVKGDPRTQKCLSILFHYQAIDDKGNRVNSPPQKVCVFLRPGQKRQVVCEYDAPPQRNDALNRQVEAEVPCRISDAPNSRVQIQDFDKARRHGRDPSFRLFNAEMDGFRVKRGPRLERINNYGSPGLWLTNENNWVIAVLSSKTRSQDMTFRARIFSNPTDNADLFEDVRVLISRRNRLPTWVPYEPASVNGSVMDVNPPVLTVTVGVQSQFQIRAIDPDDDLLSFRVMRSPRYGLLRHEIYNLLNTTLSQPLARGSRINIPRGSSSRDAMVVYYDAIPRANPTYPYNDSFTVVADDGSGIASAPLTISVRVVGSAAVGTGESGKTPSAVVAVMGLVVVVTLLVAITVVLVRRRGRDRYLHLPKTAQGGGGTEMT